MRVERVNNIRYEYCSKKMFQLLRQHPSWSIFIIATGTIAASEVIWLAYKSICKWIRWRKAQVHEVLMFNELGFECMQEHRKSSENGRLYYCQNKHCAQANIDRIIEQLNKAKYSIDLAMYSVYSVEMTRALKNALLRKVVVRIIVTLQRGDKTNCLLVDLIHHGAHLRNQNSHYFMHHKFCVIDGQERVNYLWSLKKRNYGPETTYSVLINGSLNWTDTGIGVNWENVVITSHPKMTNVFQSEFDRMWKVFSTNTRK
ncbi:uncharacterized protein Dmoj_GI13482 [Drosophila mojavensis]|uniref:Mitochondrial cardiolipin hydrolase n=1 Tax=Drosophila mojavensis TaxID=7230 RepID=B4KYZ7_DROMO|nr:uncharacterized protein Dmoj_GI13482 [Drosophila mojavensis]